MNYRRVYDALIHKAKGREILGYCEWHHIIPRCMGGEDSIENLVALTSREHFLAHWLLHEIYPEHIGLGFAFSLMANTIHNKGVRVSSRTYEASRIAASKSSRAYHIAIGNGGDIDQYDLNGAFIKRWNGVGEIQQELGYSMQNVSACALGKRYSAYGWIWTKAGIHPNVKVNLIKEVSPKQIRVKHNKYGRGISTKVEQVDSFGVVLKVWNTARDASAALGIQYQNISACIHGKRASAGGYLWKKHLEV